MGMEQPSDPIVDVEAKPVSPPSVPVKMETQSINTDSRQVEVVRPDSILNAFGTSGMSADSRRVSENISPTNDSEHPEASNPWKNPLMSEWAAQAREKIQQGVAERDREQADRKAWFRAAQEQVRKGAEQREEEEVRPKQERSNERIEIAPIADMNEADRTWVKNTQENIINNAFRKAQEQGRAQKIRDDLKRESQSQSQPKREQVNINSKTTESGPRAARPESVTDEQAGNEVFGNRPAPRNMVEEALRNAENKAAGQARREAYGIPENEGQEKSDNQEAKEQAFAIQKDIERKLTSLEIIAAQYPKSKLSYHDSYHVGAPTDVSVKQYQEILDGIKRELSQENLTSDMIEAIQNKIPQNVSILKKKRAWSINLGSWDRLD